MNDLAARALSIAESATLAVDSRVKELKAAGRPIINFGVGESDFPTPDHIVEAAAKACADPRAHRYSPVGGQPELREAVAAAAMRDSGHRITHEQVLITNGAKQAVYEAVMTLLDPGDEVLLPAPYWTTYPEAVRLAGGRPVTVTTDATAGYKVTVDQLRAARTERTKLLVLCSPSNPTGVVYDEARLAEIGRWVRENDIWVLSDEIYQQLVYGPEKFRSFPAAAPEAADRTVVVSGVAKGYAMTGWRVGWLTGPVPLVRAATTLQSHLTSNVCNVAQAAALSALTGGQDTVEIMRAAFDRRRRLLLARLGGIPGLDCFAPQGAFYVFAGGRDLLDREIRGRRPTSALDLASLILDEAGIAVVPGEAFAAPGHIRFSYALGDDDLMAGACALADLLT